MVAVVLEGWSAGTTNAIGQHWCLRLGGSELFLFTSQSCQTDTFSKVIFVHYSSGCFVSIFEMRASQISGAALCLARVFGSDSTVSSNLPFGGGQDTQALVVVQKDEKASDPDFWSYAEIHTLQHNISYNPQSECMWDSKRRERYCVFTHPEFDHGKGISFITTPQRAKILLESSLSSASEGHGFAREPSSFRTVTGLAGVEGKGRGMFANRHIPAGSIITQEGPILLIDHNWIQDKAPGKFYSTLVASAVEKLPETTRRAFEELHAQKPDGLDTRITKMWTNAYSISGGPTKDWPGLDDEKDQGMMAVHANISVSL